LVSEFKHRWAEVKGALRRACTATELIHGGKRNCVGTIAGVAILRRHQQKCHQARFAWWRRNRQLIERLLLQLAPNDPAQRL
jgi:hypothetical protein